MKPKQSEIKSFWWSPETPDKKLFGTLTLQSHCTPQLEVFVERKTMAVGAEVFGETIHGQDEHGYPITLLFAGNAGYSASGAVINQKYDAGYAVRGIWLTGPDQFLVNRISFQLHHLYGWLGRTGFKRNPGTAAKTIIEFEWLDAECFQISDDLKFCIHHTQHGKDSFQEKIIGEDAALSFESKSGFNLGRCSELITAMRILLHFASMKKVRTVWMKAAKDGHEYAIGDRKFEHEITIESGDLHPAMSEYPLEDRWLFRFSDVQSDFRQFISNWLNYVERFGEALDCYSGTIYHSLPDEITHLSLTQALEAYHGIKNASHNNQDFKAKIRELATRHAKSLTGLVDDVEDFAAKVHATRNYLTHHNPYWLSTGKVQQENDLFRLNEKLRMVFQMCVLADLGVSPDRFSRLRRQLATYVMSYQ